jgi:hypothetical protein
MNSYYSLEEKQVAQSITQTHSYLYEIWSITKGENAPSVTNLLRLGLWPTQHFP